LMIPFLISMNLWRSGAGGSIPSMAAYVFGVVGMFRLTRCALSGSNAPDEVARAAAWIAALIYAANPNLMYMQSTAMGETLYLAFFIWAGVYFCEWIPQCSPSVQCVWPEQV
jgi:predicted membrane-bound dolichyl-phosphate-mannose-protein mannosyltransferase